MTTADDSAPRPLGAPIRKWLRPSVRTVLLIVNLGIVVLPLGSIFFFRIYENQLINQTEAELISQAAFVAATFRREMIANNPDFADYGPKLENLPQLAKDERFTPIEPQVDFALQDPLPPRPAGQPVAGGGEPMARKIGEIITPILADAQRTTLAGLKVLDFNGVTVAGRFEVGQSFAHVEEIAEARKGHYASVIRQRVSENPQPALSSISRGTGIRLFAALPILYDDRLWGVVYVSRTPKNILKHIYAERQKVILAGITIAVVSLALVLLTSYRISRPIHHLIDRTRRIARGDTEAMRPLERPGTRELEALSESFVEMARSLDQRSQYIRDFATRVSHEFKTPLTSIQGAAELLSDNFDDMPPDKRRKFLENIMADGERLERLVTRLLELARADNLTPSEETIDVSQALTRVATFYTDRPVRLDIDCDAGLMVTMSDETFETIAANLIENAIQHRASNVRITAKRSGSKVQLSIADDGNGISEANRDRIFAPFFTTRREEGGTGLGLDVVRSLLEAHGGSIGLADGQGGAHFVVMLPALPGE